MPTSRAYVHGYDWQEANRLQDQALTLVDLLHGDSPSLPPGSRVLEAGCGVGAQTLTLARQNPQAQITSIDISADSVALASQALQAAGLTNVRFQQADIFHLPFEPTSFDHLFVCFVLEHLPEPVQALKTLKTFLKPGGTITVIEGDHGSAYFHPDSPAARRVIQCQVELQKRAGGNAMIGRELYPLLRQAGFAQVAVSPRMVYADSNRPELADGFTRKTFTAMMQGIRESAVSAGLIDAMTFDQGVADLNRTAEIEAPDKSLTNDIKSQEMVQQAGGVFCYTFFKATAIRST